MNKSKSNNNNNLLNENANVRPPFPPVITAQDLIPTEVSNKVEAVRIPNPFIAYRMALARELKSQKVVCHQSNVSSLAGRLWAEEPENVKNTYRKMTADAQLLYNQARGLTFLSYEQSTSDNIMQDETNSKIVNNSSSQDLEAEFLASLNLTFSQQAENLNSLLSNDQFNGLGNSLDGSFLGNMTNKEIEQRVQILEQQITFFYQLWFVENNIFF